MTFNQLYPTIGWSVEDYFNEFRDPSSDLALGAKARFALFGSNPKLCAYVLSSKELVVDSAQTEELKQLYKELNQHEFYFIVLFEENNVRSILVPDETYSDLDDARDRAKYCLQRFSPESIEALQEELKKNNVQAHTQLRN